MPAIISVYQMSFPNDVRPVEEVQLLFALLRMWTWRCDPTRLPVTTSYLADTILCERDHQPVLRVRFVQPDWVEYQWPRSSDTLPFVSILHRLADSTDPLQQWLVQWMADPAHQFDCFEEDDRDIRWAHQLSWATSHTLHIIESRTRPVTDVHWHGWHMRVTTDLNTLRRQFPQTQLMFRLTRFTDSPALANQGVCWYSLVQLPMQDTEPALYVYEAPGVRVAVIPSKRVHGHLVVSSIREEPWTIERVIEELIRLVCNHAGAAPWVRSWIGKRDPISQLFTAQLEGSALRSLSSKTR